MATIHVRYEILDDPTQPHPDSPRGFVRLGVRAVGMPDNLSAFGVGDMLSEALDDLREGVQALFTGEPVPEERTQEVAVTVGAASCDPALR